MNTDKKILEYLERAERYICTPLEQRNPDEFKALMALKAEIYSEIQQKPSGPVHGPGISAQ